MNNANLPIQRATAARITPAGRGAIAVVRVCGSSTASTAAAAELFHPVNGRAWSEQPLSRPVYGRWGRDTVEDVVLCRLSETAFEVHCHGGDAAVQRILYDLAACGIEIVEGGTQAAAELKIVDRELQSALMHATTARTAELLVEQASGVLGATYQQLFDAPWTDAGRATAAEILQSLLDWSELGLHLSQPWLVVLTGRPNVGKSSLVNALLGFRRAIVTAQPGTTRDVVSSLTAFDGWPVELSDTAGLRTAAESLEAAGIAMARERLEQADLRVVLIDVGEPPDIDDEMLLTTWPDALVVAHKADRPDQWGNRLPVGAIRASSWTGEGLEKLMTAIGRRLVPRDPPPGMPLPVSLRQVRCLREIRVAHEADDESQYRATTHRLIHGEPGA